MTGQIAVTDVRSQIVQAAKEPVITRIRKSANDKRRFLFVTYFDPHGIPTIVDNLVGWIEHSSFEFDVVNMFYGIYPDSRMKLPSNVDFSRYDGVIIHSAVAYDPSTLSDFDSQVPTPLAKYSGIKVLMKQDEHVRPVETAKAIAALGFDLVLTLVDDPIRAKLYPPETIGRKSRFLKTYTGYVPLAFKRIEYVPLKSRPIDIGYRGSNQTWAFGRLGYEKRDIGDRVLWELRSGELKTNISSSDGKRISGESWFDFLKSSKAMLAVESGSSIVDFYGDVARLLRSYRAENSDATFFDAYQAFLHNYENNCRYTAISPRHIEAAATRTVQIMYDGEFSGILEPDVHYLHLKRDHSNLSDCLKRAFDPVENGRVTEAAYAALVENPLLNFDDFVGKFDTTVTELLRSK